ncbi:phytoene/squalene synthase family protein [Spiribacter halobius]|uniref:Phytoene synthase n=1 Tax=Sediminicurvatus halobius TaxID=2182432 RepID=A0A2U2N925_9GAMM|nr:phytoene/squalene synthase family protein [Spiribacter halobius]PWG65479.1 phytoene synthase [Spiribacter halobius]UEX76502.1 squalene/phytoene synthase family protein [Spiribacter halobius]
MTEPTRLLARHASSFHVASRLLRRRDARDIATLYAFCRHVDDLADLSAGPNHELDELRAALSGDTEDPASLAPVRELARRRGLDLAPLLTLVETVRGDATHPVRIADQVDLTDYCYGVAGTVGELMCPLLGADPGRAREPAVALGIAMQMTNIARDVLEDARCGRRYLPGAWVGGLEPTEIADGSATARARVPAAVRRLVALADTYYGLAENGMRLLPKRNRAAIRVAATLYRAIGTRLAARGGDYLAGRTRLGDGERYWLAAASLLGLRSRPARPHGPRRPAPAPLLVAPLPERTRRAHRDANAVPGAGRPDLAREPAGTQACSATPRAPGPTSAQDYPPDPCPRPRTGAVGALGSRP